MTRPLASKATFDDVLDALLDQENPFPPTYLHHFSDLNSAELHEFKKVFPRVEVTRRRALLEDLEELAEADTLVLVENIGRTALQDEVPQVRTVAVRQMWNEEDKKLAPVFMRMMREDSDSEVRAAAATGLGIFIYLGEVEEIPAHLLTTVEESLFEMAKGSDDKLVRRRAVESLGFSSRPEVADLLKTAYKQKDTDWIESALFAMGRSADVTWQDDIIRMFDHPKVSVQSEAIQAAGELQLEAAREPLLNILDESEDDDVHAAATWSLAQIGGEGVRSTLEGLLEKTDDDDETSFIEEALEILDFTEEMNAFNLLEIGADDEDQYIIEPDHQDNEAESSSSEKETVKKTRHKRK